MQRGNDAKVDGRLLTEVRALRRAPLPPPLRAVFLSDVGQAIDSKATTPCQTRPRMKRQVDVARGIGGASLRAQLVEGDFGGVDRQLLLRMGDAVMTRRDPRFEAVRGREQLEQA